jgi:hypothetical protein
LLAVEGKGHLLALFGCIQIDTSSSHLDQRSDQLLAEAINGEEPRPVLVQQIDQQPFDVRSIRVLIGHDENVAIAQRGDVAISIVFVCIQPKSMTKADDFLVPEDASPGVGCIDELPLY